VGTSRLAAIRDYPVLFPAHTGGERAGPGHLRDSPGRAPARGHYEYQYRRSAVRGRGEGCRGPGVAEVRVPDRTQASAHPQNLQAGGAQIFPPAKAEAEVFASAKAAQAPEAKAAQTAGRPAEAQDQADAEARQGRARTQIAQEE